MEQTIVRIYDGRYKHHVKSRVVSYWRGSYHGFNDLGKLRIFC